MPIILEILKPLMEPEGHELIESFHKAVVDYLKLRSNQGTRFKFAIGKSATGDQNVKGIEGLIDYSGKQKRSLPVWLGVFRDFVD